MTPKTIRELVQVAAAISASNEAVGVTAHEESNPDTDWGLFPDSP